MHQGISQHTSERYASSGARGRTMNQELGGEREGSVRSGRIQASEAVIEPDNNIAILKII